MIVETIDGTVFRGIDIQAVVREMKWSAFTPPRRIKDYMKQVKERVRTLYGYSINDDSVSNFIKDLESHGLITIREGVCK